MKHEYYKLHAFVAGGLLTIVVTLQRLEFIGTGTAALFAVPLLVYLGASILLVFKSFKETSKKSESPESIKAKSEAKALKKIAKAKAKQIKKSD
jgi:uncharacterized membrane protein